MGGGHVVWTSLLTIVLSQSPALQDGVAAQLAFHRGIQLRADGQMAEAGAAFRRSAEQLESKTLTQSPALAFRTGNAWFLAGDLPRAIAAYRRGLDIDPADESLRNALDFARGQVQYPSSADEANLLRPEREWWPPWLALPRLGGFAFALYLAGCLAAMRWRLIGARRWLVAALVFIAAAAVPVIGSGIEWLRVRRDMAQPIVVAIRDVPLRLGNGTDYPSKLEVPRGCELRQLFERGGWLQVQTGGANGWIPSDAAVRGS
jgi:tetratricopeptide (TPR) repeat protein